MLREVRAASELEGLEHELGHVLGGDWMQVPVERAHQRLLRLQYLNTYRTFLLIQSNWANMLRTCIIEP